MNRPRPEREQLPALAHGLERFGSERQGRFEATLARLRREIAFEELFKGFGEWLKEDQTNA